MKEAKHDINTVTLNPSSRQHLDGKVVDAKSMGPIASTNYRGMGEAEIRIGDCYLSLPDFCDLVRYVVTNTDLADDDPRFRLVLDPSSNLRVVPGHNQNETRFDIR